MVEGNKTIFELLSSKYKLKALYSIHPSSSLLSGFSDTDKTKISAEELRKISHLKHPKDSLALFELISTELMSSNVNLVSDGIQDPGNLGTIIRLADWFGIPQLVCSLDTVDVFNPKCVQASMGSLARVNVCYTDINEFLQHSKNVNVGTDMLGENIFESDLPETMNLILGNEGNGIRLETEKLLHKTISIPRFGNLQSAESLNVSMATGIILGQYFSKKSKKLNQFL